jgi:hypothetical protein
VVDVDVLLLLAGVLSGFVTVVEVLDELELPPAGEGFTMVVLCSVLSGAAGAAVSVFCSQATKRAAPAKMQRYFFIVYGLSV